MTSFTYLAGTVDIGTASCVQCAVCHEPVSTVADMYRHAGCNAGGSAAKMSRVGWLRALINRVKR